MHSLDQFAQRKLDALEAQSLRRGLTDTFREDGIWVERAGKRLLSDKFGMSFLGRDLLSDKPYPISRAINVRLLSSERTPFSTRFNLRLLRRDPTPLSSRFKWDLLKHDRTPFSTRFNLRLLTDNPTPLSSRLGMPLLAEKKP